MAHLFLLIQDTRHLVDEVVGHDTTRCARGITNGAQFLLVLDAKSARDSRCNVDLFYILGDGLELVFPLLDEGAVRGVLGNNTDLLLLAWLAAIA